MDGPWSNIPGSEGAGAPYTYRRRVHGLDLGRRQRVPGGSPNRNPAASGNRPDASHEHRSRNNDGGLTGVAGNASSVADRHRRAECAVPVSPRPKKGGDLGWPNGCCGTDRKRPRADRRIDRYGDGCDARGRRLEDAFRTLPVEPRHADSGYAGGRRFHRGRIRATFDGDLPAWNDVDALPTSDVSAVPRVVWALVPLALAFMCVGPLRAATLDEVAELVSGLEAEAAADRARAAVRLGDLGSNANTAIDGLIVSALRDQDHLVRIHAIRALERISGQANVTITALIQLPGRSECGNSLGGGWGHGELRVKGGRSRTGARRTLGRSGADGSRFGRVESGQDGPGGSGCTYACAG